MLILDQLMPVPLKERLIAKDSSVWNKHLQFNAGEWIRIIAPSGTGKTTLMHMLYALRLDYDGTILLGDQNIRKLNSGELAVTRQQKMSIIFQDLRLFPRLTARENIELKRILQKPFCDAAHISEMAKELGITHILDQQAGICSYGEQQRISILRALVQPFEWLIMDEPFSHLDNANKIIAAKLIAEECTKRKAGFIITDLDDDDLFPYSRKLHL
jgi:ABC-type lipoprotein export system ATPase subunit